MTTRLNRRALVNGAAVMLGFAATGGIAMAQPHDHGSRTAATPPAKKPAASSAAAATAKFKPVIDAAKLCDTRGRVCRTHCLRLIKKGDVSLEACLALVNAMLPVCAATGQLAAQDAKRFVDVAQVCLDVCTDCAAECRKHSAHHAECKGCMEACDGMIAALKTVLKS